MSDSGKVEIGTPMVVFGYTEVSVYHMDALPSLSLLSLSLGLTVMDMDQKGPCFVLRCAFSKSSGPPSLPRRGAALDVMRGSLADQMD